MTINVYTFSHIQVCAQSSRAFMELPQWGILLEDFSPLHHLLDVQQPWWWLKPKSGHVISLLTTRRWLTSLRKESKMRHHRIRLHSSSFPGPFLQSPYTSHKGLLANIHQADSWLAPWLLAFLLPWRLFLQKSTKMVLCPDPLVSSDHRGPLITLSPFVLIFFSVLAITTIFQIISLFHILIFFSVH